MSRNSTAQFVRGGQATQHWWRMGLQVAKFATVTGVAMAFLTYLVLIWNNYELTRSHMAYAWWIADFTVENKGNPDKLMGVKTLDGNWVETTAIRVQTDPLYRETYARYETNAVRFLWWSLFPGLMAALLSVVIFWRTGARLGKDEHIRGSRLVSAKELKRWSNLKWKTYLKEFGEEAKSGPRFTIAGIPFPPNTVEAQTGIFGTTGVGKTTAIKELLGNIRAHGGRAVVYDRMGTMVRDFYNPETDIIINPFDARSHVWSPFLEATSNAGIAQIAEVMIPNRPEDRDPFWSQTARLVFEYAARQLLKEGKTRNADLRQAIMDLPATKLEELLAASPGQHFFGKHIEKTSASIRANMITALRFLEFLRDDGIPFSVRDWITKRDAGGIVFLTGDAEHAAATRNIISAIIEVAANALMTCEESRDPKVWFIIDELPSLNQMPFMVQKIAQVRQFGGAFVLGYQVYAQLEAVYGEKGARSISGNLNNRIVFNTPDAPTAKLFSESLGFEDLVEIRQNVTVGAHAARDGQGMAENRTERALVTASQIQAMPQFELYLRFAYEAPTTRARLVPSRNANPVAVPFVPYAGDGFGHGDLDPETDLRARSFGELTDAAKRAEFEAYFERISDRQMNDVGEGFSARYADGDRQMLWAHFARARLRGFAPDQIGPPEPGAEMAGSIEAGTGSSSERAAAAVLPYPVAVEDRTGLRQAYEVSEPSNGDNGAAPRDATAAVALETGWVSDDGAWYISPGEPEEAPAPRRQDALPRLIHAERRQA